MMTDLERRMLRIEAVAEQREARIREVLLQLGERLATGTAAMREVLERLVLTTTKKSCLVALEAALALLDPGERGWDALRRLVENVRRGCR